MMRVFYIFTLGVALLFAPSLQHRGWRGIRPLVSTRADVERLLGGCSQDDPASCLYKTENEQIVVQYSDGACEKGWPFGYDVPLNTVISIDVSPLKYVPLSALKLNLNEYEKKVSKDGSVAYVNRRQGVEVQVFDEKVGNVTYGSTLDQEYLICKDVPKPATANAAVIADPHRRLHAYGEIEAVEEMKILDHFAELLNRQPATHGYVIVYAGQRSFENEAARRLQCHTRYLTERQLIKSEQFTTINGGYRESREVELYIVHKDGPTLLPFPTVRPSRIKIIAEEKAPDVFSLCATLGAVNKTPR